MTFRWLPNFFGRTPQPVETTVEQLLDCHSFEDMKGSLVNCKEDVNRYYNDQGDALLHRLVKKPFPKRKMSLKRDLLTALLTYSDAKVNDPNVYSRTTPLHLAAKNCDVVAVETLLVFGAHINSVDIYGNTPLDLVEGPRGFLVHQRPLSRGISSPQSPTSPNSHRPLRSQQSLTDDVELLFHTPDVKSEEVQAMITMLKKYGAERGQLMKEHEEKLQGKDKKKLEVIRVGRFQDMVMMVEENVKTTTPIKIRESELSDDWTTKIAKYNYELSNSIEKKMLNVSHHFDKDPDEAMAVIYQMRELKMLRDAGSRILFLDGGGMKGLVEIEVLSQLEEQTGRKIRELFDWIVGTSTGGIIALALVHGDKSLEDVRRFYYKLKDDIFGDSIASLNFNTEKLQKFLQDIFGEKQKMSDVKYPRVLVPAVNKKTLHLKIHFFNNCFDNEFSEELVWKVARYTSAGPIYFSSMDDYVDGGVLANNPSASGLTEIQDYYRRKGQKLPISLIVSIGGGKPPSDIDIGDVNAHEYLSLGKHWWNFKEHFIDRLGNLTKLLGCAMGESESISDNVASRCKEQGIDYYRFSPQLDEVVSVGETNVDDLFKMVLKTKECIRDYDPSSKSKESFAMEFSRLVMRFHQCSISNKKMTVRMKHAPRKR